MKKIGLTDKSFTDLENDLSLCKVINKKVAEFKIQKDTNNVTDKVAMKLFYKQN